MILPHEPTAATGAPLDLDLIRKYAIAGPRYTSYPPATRFTPDFDWERLEAAIAADNRPGAGPLSLYFHLPFCESLCWYCGCNTVITRSEEHTSELQSLRHLVCRLLLENKSHLSHAMQRQRASPAHCHCAQVLFVI